jgi:hypothetical protein
MVVPAELRQVADRARPVTLAREQTLPLAPALRPLLPDGALARGSVVAVGGIGATTLALNLAAGPSRAGSWVVVVGLGELGLAAAAEAGIDLRRVGLVDLAEDASWAGVVAALVGGIDVIVIDGRAPLTPSEGRRLAARARERGSVLVPVTPGSIPTGRRRGAWPADVTLTVTAGRWDGLGSGHGHLHRRQARVEAEGRGRASRPRAIDLWLPSSSAPPSAGSNVVAGAAALEPARNKGAIDERDATVVRLRPAGRRAG